MEHTNSYSSLGSPSVDSKPIVTSDYSKLDSSKDNSNFASYLRGLWEGDGSVWLPSTTHAPSGKKYAPNFLFTFSRLDLPLAEKLQSIIGGRLRKHAESNAYKLEINNVSQLIKLVLLIGPYLRTPKIRRFNDLIRWLNNNSGVLLEEVSLDTSDMDSNAWLAGFIDADGSFDINVRFKSEGRPKNSVKLRMRLEQRMIDPYSGLSYNSIFTKIARFLSVKLAISHHNQGKEYYLITVRRISNLSILVKYFSSYPMFSSKRLNFEDLRTRYTMVINKEHLTEVGRIKIKSIKMGMNSRRTFYNWDHLKDL